ncbi:hypothetical protein AURDEDRAFT_176415 [Auricularia subglabra TFB-10046 SS5]|uniref:Uncharacterized protein n=1 Tax=Auricularia subglabra (strain TFB-10046 / SS5) TaxID=717982 RepID=J0D6Q9_AURST|nr:hypothetical protein AURDEDRAFT_176415 [Auricularia subglabra TFB-10046 SS5]
MPPKLLATSPKTRRQRAAVSRQLRSRTSNGSSSCGPLAPARPKKKAPVLKKAIPLCKTCTAGGSAVYHYWTQCPKKKQNAGSSAKSSAKSAKGKKSTRTVETDARHAALLAQLSDDTNTLLASRADAMSVDSDQTTSDTDPSDSEDDSVHGTAAVDVSMAGADGEESDGVPASDGGAAAEAPVQMSDFFSDSDDASDSESPRGVARGDSDQGVATEAEDEDESAASEAGDDQDDDDEAVCADDESDGNGASAGSAAGSDGEASDDGSSSSGEWDGEEIGVAELIANASDGTDAGGHDSAAEQDASDTAEGDAGRYASSEGEAAEDYEGSGDEHEGEAGDSDVQPAEGSASGEDENAEDASDGEVAVDAPNGTYFNQAAHVGRIDSDDDMDSESRVAKLHQAAEDKGNSLRAIELHEELENPSPDKVQEQKALLAEVAGGPPPAGPANGDPASTRRAALRAMLTQSLDQREALEAACGGSTMILNGWKGNSAGGESIVYKRNNGQRWARVNKTHKTLKHDFKPMFQSTVQKGEYMADCLGASVMIIAMPHGGLGNAYTWHSDQIEVDAPDLPQAIRDLWFQQLAGARRQHVTEMAAALEALRAEQKATREQLIELNRTNDKLKKRLDKTTAKLLREREARL